MNPPRPVPGHFLLWARELDLEIALPNADRPQVTRERAGGFRVIPVPQLRPLLAWDGHPEVAIQLVGRLDGRNGPRIQPTVDKLRRLGSKVSSEIRRPPLVRPIGRIPNPTTGSNADWVVTSLQIVEEEHARGSGVLTVARCTVELTQWTASQILEQKEAGARSATRPYTWKSGDTLAEVAERELGDAAKDDLIRDANPKIKKWSHVQTGDKIRLPGAARR
jgi:hypothetical protein